MIRPKPADNLQAGPRSARGLAVTGVLIAVVLAGCGSTAEVEGATGTEAQDPTAVEAGSALFAANCASCHGLDARGTDQGPSFLSAVYEPNHHADFAFVLAAQRGVPQHHWNFGDMPPVAGLSADELEQIASFVRKKQRLEGFEPYPP